MNVSSSPHNISISTYLRTTDGVSRLWGLQQLPISIVGSDVCFSREPSHGRGAANVSELLSWGAQYVIRYTTPRKFVRATPSALLCASLETVVLVKLAVVLCFSHLAYAFNRPYSLQYTLHTISDSSSLQQPTAYLLFSESRSLSGVYRAPRESHNNVGASPLAYTILLLVNDRCTHPS